MYKIIKLEQDLCRYTDQMSCNVTGNLLDVVLDATSPTVELLNQEFFTQEAAVKFLEENEIPKNNKEYEDMYSDEDNIEVTINWDNVEDLYIDTKTCHLTQYLDDEPTWLTIYSIIHITV